MAVSNSAIFKTSSCCYSDVGFFPVNGGFFRGGIRVSKFGGGKWRMNCGYEDKGHLDYYMVCGEKKKGNKGWNEVSSKKRMKLLKGLVNDLGTFSELGFSLDVGSDLGFVADDEKNKIMNEAAETLLAQLKQLRAAEEEMNKKQGKKKSKSQDCQSSSSSESSTSSDSECDQVVDMNYLRNKAVLQTVETPEKLLLPNDDLSSPKAEQECCNMILDATLPENATIEVLKMKTRSLEQPKSSQRIEVCMGGKCKKSGAPALMEELQRVVGEDGVVVGCKCMGKCKSGPNVRVMNNISDDLVDDSSRTPTNPLFIGVGLEDVELIAANFARENKDSGLAVAPLC